MRQILKVVAQVILANLFVAAILSAILPAVQQAQNPAATVSYTPVVPSIVGDGVTDDTAAMNAFLDSVPNFTEVVIPQNCSPLFTGTINFDKKMGVRLVARCGAGSSANGPKQAGVCFQWKLATPGVPMVTMHGSRGCEIENITMITTGTNNPSCGIDLDLPTGFAGGYPVTDCIIRRCGIIGPLADCAFSGAYISRQATTNCDFITFDRTWIQVSGVNAVAGTRTGNGIVIGNNFNAKQVCLIDCNISYATCAVNKMNGSMCVRNLATSCCDTVFYIGTSGGPDTIEGGPAGHEYAGYILDVAGGNNPLFVSGLRGAALRGPALFRIKPAAPRITVIGCSLIPAAVGTMSLFDPSTNLNAGVRFTSIGNNYGVPSPCMAVCPNFVSTGDLFTQK